ncbi:hypothetical protein [Chryseolinea sp. H1M3-3]|uniref:hypothetical protein n=1 Tax=Chryseolinea sp. H1M3-3 TaxID=3034144 RepID=UPI0023EBE5E9|nr:hypothetical protein [Chryseolinea sp. H1M3-3]
MAYIIFALFALINSVFIQKLTEFDTNSILLSSLLSIIFSITYYCLMLIKDYPLIAKKIYSFWIVSGIFIYASGTFIIFYFFKYKEVFFTSVADQFWEIQNIIFIMRTLFFAVAIIICIRNS